MKTHRFLAALAWLVFISAWRPVAEAAQPPEVASQIPRDVSVAWFVSSPAEAVANLDTVLSRFKQLSSELDLRKQGEKLREELGENVLTPEGLEALGVDPAGTSAFYSNNPSRGGLFVVALKDPGRFKQKLLALIQKRAQDFKGKPKFKAGIEIYEVDKGYVGIKAPWCVILPPEAVERGQKDKELLAFFKKGRKLASHPAFQRAVNRLPDRMHTYFYLDMDGLLGSIRRDSEHWLRESYKYREKNAPVKEKKRIRRELKQRIAVLRADHGKVHNALAFIESMSAGWTFEANEIKAVGFIGATRSGFRTLKKLLPALVTPPQFHEGLAETAILGAWVTLDPSALLERLGDLPAYYNTTLRAAVEREAKPFREQTKIDLFKDVLGQLPGHGAFYVLPPGNRKPDPKLPLGDQIVSMLRLAFVAQVANPARVTATVRRFNQAIAAHEKAPGTRDVAGTSISVFEPAPGISIGWGVKGDTVFLTLGKGTAEALVTVLPAQGWGSKATTGPVGAGQLDFAVLGEAISSAMSGGLGGDDAARFRMMGWPILQQVLGKLSRLTVSARLVPGGLLANGKLSFR